MWGPARQRRRSAAALQSLDTRAKSARSVWSNLDRISAASSALASSSSRASSEKGAGGGSGGGGGGGREEDEEEEARASSSSTEKGGGGGGGEDEQPPMDGRLSGDAGAGYERRKLPRVKEGS